MKKGGYQILDLKRTPLTSGESANISGAFDAIKNANGKRVVVSGLTVADKDYSDFECYFNAGENIFEGSIELFADSITISIALGDDVTVTIA